MNVIKGRAEMIRSQVADDDRLAESAESIVAAAESLQGVSENARELGTVIERRGEVSTVDLVEVVEAAVETVRAEFEDASVTVDTPATCPAETTVGIQAAVTNIVENAAEHGGPGPSVTVRVSEHPPRVSVEDDGPGIPEHEIRTIESGEVTDLQHGSGAGLWLAERVASYSDGSIEMENTGTGAVVTMTFPPSD